jgi:hypothetical protein
MSASTESPPVAPPVALRQMPPPAARLSLDDFLSREPRLRGRPTLAGGFARQCARQRLTHATLPDFTAALDAFEHGAT